MRNTPSRTSISASASPPRTRATSILSCSCPRARHRPPWTRPSPGRRLRRHGRPRPPQHPCTRLLERRVSLRTSTPRRRPLRDPLPSARPGRRRSAPLVPMRRRARSWGHGLFCESKRLSAHQSLGRGGAPALLRLPPSPRPRSERCLALRTAAKVASARARRSRSSQASEDRSPGQQSPQALIRQRTAAAKARRLSGRPVPRRGSPTEGRRGPGCASRFSQRLRSRSPEASLP